MLTFTSGKLRLLPQNEHEYSGRRKKQQVCGKQEGVPMANELEMRIVELETKIAYQEDLLDTLNNIVAAQQQQLDQLEKVCRALIERWEDMNEALSSHRNEPYEIPPHY